jgi:glycosyltransferase involved in cell wall biosynthesis
MSAAFPGRSPIANHMQRMARGLRECGHSVQIVAPRNPNDGIAVRGEDKYGTPYRSFNTPPKPRFFPFYPHWSRAIRPGLSAAVADLVESERPHAMILIGETWYAFDGLRRFCQARGIRVLGYPIEWFPPYLASVAGLSWFDQWMQRHVTYPNCDGIVGISRFWEGFASRRGIPATVVPSFSKFGDDEIPQCTPEVHQKFRILFVGRWVRRELPATVFSALEIALERGVDLELVVLGSVGKSAALSQVLEERPALRRLAALPRVRERIRFLGFVPDEELIRQMHSADAFVLLRRQNRETQALFPTRLPEFLATGKPVIVSDAGDLSLYLKHGQSALVIPPGDHPQELADAIIFLATHPKEAQSIGRGGRVALEESFSQKKLAERLAGFIRTLLPSKRDAAGPPGQQAEACGKASIC